jgi:hypothetical protein
MGLELPVPHAPSALADIATRLEGIGVLVMVDNAFLAPGKPLPAEWRDARVKTPAGTITILRRGDAVALVVFGNADDALRATQQRIAAALSAT